MGDVKHNAPPKRRIRAAARPGTAGCGLQSGAPWITLRVATKWIIGSPGESFGPWALRPAPVKAEETDAT